MSDSRFSPADLATIRNAPMFANLSPGTLDGLLAQSEVQDRPRGAVVFAEDTPATTFFLVLGGWVKLYRMTVAGDEAVVGIFGPGECLAEAPCLAGGDYPVSAEAVSDVRLLAVSARAVVELNRRQPEVGLAMLASTLLHLRQLVGQVEELKARTGPQRLADFLVELAPVKEGPCTIPLPYEKRLIASKLGMQPESLSRAFQRLGTVGVRALQTTVEADDIARLAEFAGRERAQAFRCPAFRAGCRPG